MLPSLRLKPHPTVKAAVVAEAKERGLSLNHVVVEILSEAFRVRFKGSGRKTNAAWGTNGRGSASDQMPVPVPEKLKKRIEAEAARRQRERRRDAPPGRLPIYSANEVVERIFCDRYGLEYVER